MNYRILLCLTLILGSVLSVSADCLDANPGDVEYDCTNDIEDTKPLDESEEKVEEEHLEYTDNNDYEDHDDQPKSSESTSTSTTEKPAPVEEEEYDYDSEEHSDPETQQDDHHIGEHESNEHTGKQTANDDDTTTTSHTIIENNDDQHINLFYDAIKATLTSSNYSNGYRYVKHPERVDCMITEMRNSKVMDKINKESYFFDKNTEHDVKLEFRNVTTFMYDLERVIQDANFDCTQMGNTHIFIIIIVAVLAVVLLIAFIRRRYK